MSDTPPAKHHRVQPVGDSAGQQPNRVFERHKIQAHLPLLEPTWRERTVGEVLALLAGTGAGL